MGRQTTTKSLCTLPGLGLKTHLNEVILFHGTKVWMGFGLGCLYHC